MKILLVLSKLKNIKNFFNWVKKDVEKGDIKAAEKKIVDEVKETREELKK